MEIRCYKLDYRDDIKMIYPQHPSYLNPYMVKCTLEEGESALGLGGRERWYRWFGSPRGWAPVPLSAMHQWQSRIQLIEIEALEILSVIGQNVKSIEDIVPKV